LGIATIADLLAYYPFRYDDFSAITPIAALKVGEKQTVLGQIEHLESKRIAGRGRRPMMVLEASLYDQSGLCFATWFGQPWLANQLSRGQRLLINGKVQFAYGYMRFNSPLIAQITQDDDPRSLGMQPVYRVKQGLPLGWMRRYLKEALAQTSDIPETLPQAILEKYHLIARGRALAQVHFPKDHEQLHQALRRLKYEEAYQLESDLKRPATAGFAHDLRKSALRSLAEHLPFQLSESQRAAIHLILSAMAKPQPMSVLLDGDVGSGKTVVALSALVCAAANSKQAAMMAPTTVLAAQYAAKLGPLLDQLQISWGLLSAEVEPTTAQDLRERLRAGGCQVVFGTTALIQPSVDFAQLSLVVIDEQHRFGVEQRDQLLAKGDHPDYLALSATPIPRTLALTLYGDMQVAYLQKRPGQQSVRTVVWPVGRLPDVYSEMHARLARGEQVYVICPLISEAKEAEPDAGEVAEETWVDDLFDFDDEKQLKAAEQEVSALAALFPETRVELMTSKLAPEQKQQVMQDFRRGSCQVMVSTTVVEVGLDVPQATMMVVLNAERFGLAQLHQLRGRVGRGAQPGIAYLISSSRQAEALRRLAILSSSDDGLAIASADLAERREGDVLGLSQHGRSPLKLLNPIRDQPIIECAYDDVRGGSSKQPRPQSSRLRAEP
jgi:ATP-dependent DNA helicase RecG